MGNAISGRFGYKLHALPALPTERQRILKMRQLLLLLVAASAAANVKEDQTTTAAEDYTATEDYTTTIVSETTTTGTTTCPLGWIDDGKLGCFFFAPQMAGLSWLEALEYCEEQVHLLT